ncbi:MAG TPA: HPF/RaiA family ribosome-associated protein [Thermodesulfobacteriota bacterium]|nr:HPF/RaiA family ribosome-associated protein [Thermodesulfobacteriota bacterium]
MQVSVTIRHIDNQARQENLRNYTLKKIKRVERYIKSRKNPSEVRVVLFEEKFRNICEILVISGTFKITSSVESDEMHGAIDRAIDGTIKRLKKLSEMRIKTRRRGSAKPRENTGGTNQKPLRPSNEKRLEGEGISLERVPLKPMSVEEAILQLKVSGEDILTFRNSETGEINTLHNRRGKVVLIAP